MNEIVIRIKDGEDGFVYFSPDKNLNRAVCELVIPHLSSTQVDEHMSDFATVGLTADDIAKILRDWQVKHNIPGLLASGASVEKIIERIGFDREQLEEHFDLFLKYGADINELLKKIGRDPWWYQSQNIEELIEKGAKPDVLARYAIDGCRYDVGIVIEALLEHGAGFENVVAAIINSGYGELLIDHYKLLSRYGEINLGLMIHNRYIDYREVLSNLKILASYGVKINAKRFAKMVARSKGCSYRDILAECGIRA